MQTLNPMSMALCGQSLIEASAGTGKTYTITGLYLRYLLGLQKATGEDEALNTPLSVEQILVVTFTEAATQEIKDRVRARIINARDALLGKKPDDELIEQVINEVTDKHAAFDLLDAAAKSMDEAAIFTIHGFCQRMLKQHAFESGVAFNLEFILDERELIQETLNDFWRAFVYPQSKERTQAITDIFPVPASLYSQVVSLLNKQEATITPEYDLDDIWQARDNFVAKVPAFKKACVESEFINALKASDLSKSKTPAHKNSLAALEEYLNNDELFFGALKSYLQTFADSAATGDDFQELVSEFTSTDLTNMFEEWYYGEGFPKYSVSWAQNDGKLKINIAQETSSSTPFFTNNI
uniref:UvrD-helicase domain-containing protein n=1 Tax=Pseudoalteromonas sp. TaxID=53249 RepID=UPI003D0AD548